MGPALDALELNLGALFLAWLLLPYGMLAAAQGETLIGRPASLFALRPVTAATTAAEVDVLLLPSGDAQGPLLLRVTPIYLAIGVGLLIGLKSASRTVWRRARS